MLEPAASKIRNKNIRSTALSEFWDNEYDQSVYLWMGSKHKLKYDKLQADPTCSNVLSSINEVDDAHATCVQLYYKILPQISRILNDIHQVNLSTRFWQIAFGYWLYRHISNVFEKYSRLVQLDGEKTSFKLLDAKSFHIPHNHVDYLLCFAHDFGVEQLVSQYFNLIGVQKPQISKEFVPTDVQAISDISFSKYSVEQLKKVIKRYIINRAGGNPTIAILGAGFSEDTLYVLRKESDAMIEPISLPLTFLKRNENNMPARLKLTEISRDNEFEKYLAHTLVYSMPKDFVENFRIYYRAFTKDLEKRTFTHIVSEDWISNIPGAIYIGLAKENGRKFISYEHGFGTYFYKNDYDFICYDAADEFLSVGWQKSAANIVKGGFASRTIIPFESKSDQTEILFISRTVLLYEVELIHRNMVDPHFLGDLTMIDGFIKLMTPRLLNHFVFRPRPPGVLCWDTVFQLDLHERGIKIDSGNFSASIHRSRIVVIDHISTAIAEIILTGTPFILLYDIRTISVNEEASQLLDELINCGLLHLAPDSAIDHLNLVYDDVQKWWTSVKVQAARKKLNNVSISPASKTTDYLLSLLN